MRGAHRTTCVSMLRAGLSTRWSSPWSDSTTATLLRCRIAGDPRPDERPVPPGAERSEGPSAATPALLQGKAADSSPSSNHAAASRIFSSGHGPPAIRNPRTDRDGRAPNPEARRRHGAGPVAASPRGRGSVRCDLPLSKSPRARRRARRRDRAIPAVQPIPVPSSRVPTSAHARDDDVRAPPRGR